MPANGFGCLKRLFWIKNISTRLTIRFINARRGNQNSVLNRELGAEASLAEVVIRFLLNQLFFSDTVLRNNSAFRKRNNFRSNCQHSALEGFLRKTLFKKLQK